MKGIDSAGGADQSLASALVQEDIEGVKKTEKDADKGEYHSHLKGHLDRSMIDSPAGTLI